MAIARDELDAAARRGAPASDRVFTVGYNRRYAPLALAVRDALAATPGPRAALYRVNAGAVPAGHWTLDPAVGGGRIVGEACHMLDLLAFWLGPELVDCRRDAASAARAGRRDSPQDFAVSLRFRDAARRRAPRVARLHGARSTRSSPRSGSRSTPAAAAWCSTTSRGSSVHGLPGRSAAARAARTRATAPSSTAFRDAIRGAPSPLLGVEEAWRAADLALRIDESLRRA